MAAIQGQAHALCIQGDDIVAHCLEHVAVELIHPRGFRQQIGQGNDLMAMPLAQEHVVARVLPTTAQIASHA